MFVGVARLVLEIPSARSLKDRRRVVRSFKDRVRAKLGVSIAEVGDVERYQLATLAVAVVSADAARCDEVLAHAASMASTLRDAVLADVRTLLLPMGEGGSGVSDRPDFARAACGALEAGAPNVGGDAALGAEQTVAGAAARGERARTRRQTTSWPPPGWSDEQ